MGPYRITAMEMFDGGVNRKGNRKIQGLVNSPIIELFTPL